MRPIVALAALGLVSSLSCQKPCPCDASAFKDDDPAPADKGKDACQLAADHLLKPPPDGLGCKEIDPNFAAFCRDMTQQNVPICPVKLAKVKTCAEANTVCTKR
jgi:hypothetical protein